MVIGHRNKHGENTGESREFTREHTSTAETSRLVRWRCGGEVAAKGTNVLLQNMITEPRGDSDRLCVNFIKQSFFVW